MYSPSPVDSLRNDIATLSSQVTRLTQELEQTRHDVNYLIESSIDTPNIYLKPNDLAKLVGCSHSTIKRYRNDGTIKDSSIKKVKREKRTDYYYHRFAEIKDIEKELEKKIKTKK